MTGSYHIDLETIQHRNLPLLPLLSPSELYIYVYIWAIPRKRPTGYIYEVGPMASKISVTGQQLSIF